MKWFLNFFHMLGPGIVTGLADNDAAGITVYSLAGAHYGYGLLWVLLLSTVALMVVLETCSRLGVVTGKGLSALIRENFGVQWTLFAMAALLIVNMATVVAEFVGMAASLEIVKIPRIVGVPVVTWVMSLVVIRWSYRYVERVFLVFGLVYVTYVISSLLAKPDWGTALFHTVIPTFQFHPLFFITAIAMVGTTVTPWMQFYIQAAVVDRGSQPKDYSLVRWDVYGGAILSNVIAFFIVTACAATLYAHGVRIHGAEDAALAIAPLAGDKASLLFAVGLFGASTFGAFVVPLSTAYAICEAFGWESGVNKRWGEAPIFYSLFIFLVVMGAGVALLPYFNPVGVIVVAESIAGILLPAILVFTLLLANNRRLMGKQVNSRFHNAVIGIVMGLVCLLALLLLGVILIKPG